MTLIERETFTQATDALAAAIAVLAVTLSDDVAKSFHGHIRTAIGACPEDKPIKRAVLELIADHVQGLRPDPI